MASPTVLGRSEGAVTTAGTSHVITFPASSAAGELILIIFGATLGGSYSYEESFTQLTSGVGLVGVYKQLDGTEGTSTTITTSSSKSQYTCYRISGHADPATRAPEIASASSGTDTDPNPPSITPTGGSKDYLFIAAFAQAGEEADDDTWCNSAPTNYTNLLQKTTGTTGAANTNSQLASAERQLTASSEDPGTFNTDQSLGWNGITIAVHPAAAATISFEVGMIPF